MSLSIDIGCGDDKRADLGLDVRPTEDADIQADVAALPLRDGVVSEAYLIDVVEHLRLVNAEAALSEVYRVLEPGGQVWIRTPDFEWIVENWSAVPIERLQRKLYGGWTYPLDSDEAYPENRHQTIWTADYLQRILQRAGFDEMETNRDLPEPNHWNMGVVAWK